MYNRGVGIFKRKSQEDIHYHNLHQIDDIYNLDPIGFEHFIKSLFERMGATVETTAISGDGGVDLVIHKGKRLAIAQCKRYKDCVGQPVVRDLYGTMLHNQAAEAYLVTTGMISLPAQQFARGKPIILVDQNELLHWIDQFPEENKPGIKIETNWLSNLWNNQRARAAILITLALGIFSTGCIFGLFLAGIAQGIK
ncbi:MAG: restriction endonuclease [Anaerolineaceae bacterium]|nr:restriction endonuclease [Anaerolineaceae bacterium]